MNASPLPPLRLYHYWRSSSSWRVRWAFALKGIQCEFVSVNLLSDEPESPEHRARNPMGFVPTLELLEGPHGAAYQSPGSAPLRFLAESVAIIEWAEEMVPKPRLLPADPLLRARARQLAEAINSGTQPIQNPNVATFHSQDPAEQKRWNQHWIRNGLRAYETLVRSTSGRFSIGDEVTFPDLFLIPQCYNAIRFDVPLTEFPTICGIHEAALKTDACQASHPDRFAPKT